MAPDKKLLKDIKVTFDDCQKALLRLKLMCKANQITDPDRKLSLTLSCIDDEVSDWLLENIKEEENFTQRKFELRILQESKRRSLIKILKEKQQEEETVHTYVKRMIPLLRKNDYDLETREAILIQLARDMKSSIIIEKRIKSWEK